MKAVSRFPQQAFPMHNGAESSTCHHSRWGFQTRWEPNAPLQWVWTLPKAEDIYLSTEPCPLNCWISIWHLYCEVVGTAFMQAVGCWKWPAVCSLISYVVRRKAPGNLHPQTLLRMSSLLYIALHRTWALEINLQTSLFHLRVKCSGRINMCNVILYIHWLCIFSAFLSSK